MNHTLALEIYQALRGTTLTRLRDDLLRYAVRYARIRTDWRLASPADRRAMDRSRRAAHDALIDACNILSRNMADADEDIGWRVRLGDERRRIGDWACHVHAILGVEGR